MSDFEVHPVGTVAALRQRAEAAETRLNDCRDCANLRVHANARIAQLQERAEAAERERDEAIKRGDDAEREFDKLAVRTVGLGKALRKYGRHDSDCFKFSAMDTYRECTCGLDAALRPAEPKGE